MPTLDYTGSAVAGAQPDSLFHQKGGAVVLHRRMKVSDIIAADTTMTTNGYIAADDIVQALHVPKGFSVDYGVIHILTACTATVTLEVGLAGGAELIGSTPVAMDAAAGTWYRTVEADSYDLGHVFDANDTIDCQFLIANCAVGDFELFVVGHMLNYTVL
jgi:hypothetical protein